MTLLLQRVLDFYNVEATVQKSLFDSAEDKPTIIPPDNINDDPPPYIWGEA
jgi:hypothetical protein